MVFVAIVPFLDEERYIGELLDSIDGQSRPPDRLLLVDDGSTDGSRPVAERFAEGRDGVRVLRRPRRQDGRDRLSGGSALAAFQWALERVDVEWEVAGKLDADLRLTPSTFETIERAFRADEGLGIAGAYLSEPGAGGRLVALRSRPEHVNGATKFYRRACYREISPLPVAVGWDMIDTATARLRGWRTASLRMPEGDPVHLRPMGSQDGTLRGCRRWGLGAWAMGEAPLHVILHSAQRFPQRPWVLGGLNYGLGWVLGALRGAPRADPDVRAFVRRNQLRRIRRRFARLGRREPTGA